MDEQRKTNIDADLVPAYQYRVFVCQPLDKDIEQVLNKMGKFGWKYTDFKIKSGTKTGILIMERKKMVPKPTGE